MNLVAGGLLLAFSALVLAATRHLGKFSAGEIGPGFFPALCAVLLGLVGVVLLVMGLREAAPHRSSTPRQSGAAGAWRAAVITGAALAFALLLKGGGLALAVFATVWVSTRAGDISHRPALVLSLSLALVLTAFFVGGLRLHMPALPAFLR